MDVVSPELALVDPDLRRADVARLARQHASLRLIRSTSLPAGAPAAPSPTLGSGLRLVKGADSRLRHRSWPLRIAQLGFFAVLLAAGIMVAIATTRDQTGGRTVLPTRPTLEVATPSAIGSADADLARRLLDLLVQTPSRLPRAFIDSHTGLAKDLQAVCNPASNGRHLCVVRVTHERGQKLYVQYGTNGFSW